MVDESRSESREGSVPFSSLCRLLDKLKTQIGREVTLILRREKCLQETLQPIDVQEQPSRGVSRASSVLKSQEIVRAEKKRRVVSRPLPSSRE